MWIERKIIIYLAILDSNMSALLELTFTDPTKRHVTNLR